MTVYHLLKIHFFIIVIFKFYELHVSKTFFIERDLQFTRDSRTYVIGVGRIRTGELQRPRLASYQARQRPHISKNISFVFQA